MGPPLQFPGSFSCSHWRAERTPFLEWRYNIKKRTPPKETEKIMTLWVDKFIVQSITSLNEMQDIETVSVYGTKTDHTTFGWELPVLVQGPVQSMGLSVIGPGWSQKNPELLGLRSKYKMFIHVYIFWLRNWRGCSGLTNSENSELVAEGQNFPQTYRKLTSVSVKSLIWPESKSWVKILVF